MPLTQYKNLPAYIKDQFCITNNVNLALKLF